MELAIAREQTQFDQQDQPSQPAGVRMPVPRLLYRREASDHLATEHGIEVKPEQLASWALDGGGPSFRLLAGRAAKAVYATSDLDRWARGYLGPLVSRVSEHPAHQGSAAA
jgi:hypothetical protein